MGYRVGWMVVLGCVGCTGRSAKPGATTSEPEPPDCSPPAEVVVCDAPEELGEDGLEPLAGCTHLYGDLAPGGADLTPLADLVWVDGSVIVVGGAELGRLQEVTGLLAVSSYEGAVGLQCLANADTLLLDGEGAAAQVEAMGSLTAVRSLQAFGTDLADLDGLPPLDGLTELVVHGGALERLTWPGTASRAERVELGAGIASYVGLEDLTHIDTLEISGDAPDLTGLGGLRTVGTLEVVGARPSLLTLDGLDALVSADTVRVESNEGLQELGELPVLASVETLEIRDNPLLRSVGGLPQLTDVEELLVEDNPLLSEIAGLGVLTLPGLVRIAGNGQLASLSLDAERIRRLELQGADAIVELDTFPSLVDVGDLVIEDNRSLLRVGGFDTLAAANLHVLENPVLQTIDGFGPLERLSGYADVTGGGYGTDGAGIRLLGNPALRAVAFPSLVSPAWIELEANGDYDLTGFETVEIVGSLTIEHHDAPTDLSALEGIERVEYLRVEDNASLCQSAVDAWVASRTVWNATTARNDDGC